tara:strand:+ start:446 stop:1453 length:1008 start_codon:yes stop_codon:yes gene_type:complete
MKQLSMKQLTTFLNKIIETKIQSSIMIWGAPGIGKSSIISQVAKSNSLDLIDLRISQLAPTDLRGIPVPRENIAQWYPPEFLPTEGSGILFLDEINMAPPAVQGIAQQLILDRKVGSYRVPKDWFVWAAGNRKQDYAAVFDMPAPLANRFIHLEAVTNLKEFKSFALENNIDDRIISFLNFRPNLLHKIDKNSPSWPSPRSWMMANELIKAGIQEDSAIGNAAAAEFRSFCKIYKTLPDIKPILKGQASPDFPKDISAKYALVCALSVRAETLEEVENSFTYISKKGGMEWLNQCAFDVTNIWKKKKNVSELVDLIVKNKDLMQVAENISKLLAA